MRVSMLTPHNRITRGLLIASTALACIGSMLATAPTSANAAVAKEASINRNVGPETCSITDAEVVVQGTHYNFWWCKWGAGTADTAGHGPFQAMTAAIGFDRRIWFHQDAGGGGWGDCYFSGGKGVSWDLSGRDQNPGNIQVTTNHASCPKK